jgi:hypothetical protein
MTQARERNSQNRLRAAEPGIKRTTLDGKLHKYVLMRAT